MEAAVGTLLECHRAADALGTEPTPQAKSLQRIERLRLDAQRIRLWLTDHLAGRPTVRVRPGIGAVVSELSSPFEDIEISEWFARPNSWLDGDTPATRFADDQHLVLDAARVDSYLVT